MDKKRGLPPAKGDTDENYGIQTVREQQVVRSDVCKKIGRSLCPQVAENADLGGAHQAVVETASPRSALAQFFSS